jgi:hypothetical protein
MEPYLLPLSRVLGIVVKAITVGGYVEVLPHNLKA